VILSSNNQNLFYPTTFNLSLTNIQLISDYRTSNGYERAMELMDDEDDEQNIPSDIDSQVSVTNFTLYLTYFSRQPFFSDVSSSILHTAT
jgi:hypothetical protein